MKPPESEEFVWCHGRILPLGELVLPGADRVFEHGLGVFESMRGQHGTVPLWDRHRHRLIASARALRLMIDEPRLPDAADFAALIHRNGLEQGPCRLRLVLTGGSADAPGVVFFTSRPLGAMKTEGLRLADAFWPVDLRDPLIRYKSLNYWARRLAHDGALASGADDALSQDQHGAIWESAHAALFVVAGDKWYAPPASGPMLVSVAADEVEKLAKASGQLDLARRMITTDMLATADEVILANAVRGPMSVGSWRDHRYDPSGPVFTTLRELWRKAWF